MFLFIENFRPAMKEMSQPSKIQILEIFGPFNHFSFMCFFLFNTIDDFQMKKNSSLDKSFL